MRGTQVLPAEPPPPPLSSRESPTSSDVTAAVALLSDDDARSSGTSRHRHTVALALSSVRHLKHDEQKSKPSFIIRQLSTAESAVTSKATKVFRSIHKYIFSATGLCGVRGVFFEPVVMMRELVEIAIQTSQAYQCSKQTTKFWVNATFTLLIAVNCYSSLALHRFGKSSVSAYRVTVLGVDLVLDTASGSASDAGTWSLSRDSNREARTKKRDV